ncbi:MAG: hypothetical protein AAF850_11535 [Pseudomonadota bacterium]
MFETIIADPAPGAEAMAERARTAGTKPRTAHRAKITRTGGQSPIKTPINTSVNSAIYAPVDPPVHTSVNAAVYAPIDASFDPALSPAHVAAALCPPFCLPNIPPAFDAPIRPPFIATHRASLDLPA